MTPGDYTPTEGDVLELTQQVGGYVVVDRVTETTCYYRHVDDRGGLLEAAKMPIARFVRIVASAGAKLHCGRKGW